MGGDAHGKVEQEVAALQFGCQLLAIVLRRQPAGQYRQPELPGQRLLGRIRADDQHAFGGQLDVALQQRQDTAADAAETEHDQTASEVLLALLLVHDHSGGNAAT
ncbi:hypothetical protein D9M73_238700 [compost metagenome]